MMYPQILLGLAATVAAIDIRFYESPGGHCYDGAWVQCANMNPGICCPVYNFYARTAGVVAVPGDWTLTGKGYRGVGCETWNQAAIGRGRDICLGATGAAFTGAAYWFGDNVKRSVEQECTGTTKPTQLGLADGTVYDLANLSDEQLEEM